MARRSGIRASSDPDVAAVAALIGDPARATMLCALLDGRELPAGELAYRANAAPNAASAHLSKLVGGGLLCVRACGRQRFFRLASAHVARAIEALCVIAAPPKIVALAQAHIASDLRVARSCYDHLAGRLGVAVTDALVHRQIILPEPERAYRLTTQSDAFFAGLGLNLEDVRNSRRQFARQCMDWSERRPHLAGALGAALCDVFLTRGWVERKQPGRALRITTRGRRWMHSALTVEDLE